MLQEIFFGKLGQVILGSFSILVHVAFKTKGKGGNLGHSAQETHLGEFRQIIFLLLGVGHIQR